MAGYANRVVRLDFPELTEPGEPTLFVTIRNPKTTPLDQLTAQDVTLDATGRAVDTSLAALRSRELMSRLILAWRMYDAAEVALDPDTGLPLDQQPLPTPATPELVAKLPAEVFVKITNLVEEAFNPK